MTFLTVPYGVYLDYQKPLPKSINNKPCDKDAASFVITNMIELTSKMIKWRERSTYFTICG